MTSPRKLKQLVKVRLHKTNVEIMLVSKTMSANKKKLFIAGGGTGGHLYPALAIAAALKKLDSQWEIEFVGTKNGLEVTLIPKSGYVLHLISSEKLNRKTNPLKKIVSLVFVFWGCLQAVFLLLKHRPNVVLGVGGYASGPMVLMAAIFGIKTLIWEPNAHPGMANRWLAPWVDLCVLVFSEAKLHLKPRESVLAGMPVRSEIEEQAHRQIFGPSSDSVESSKLSQNGQSIPAISVLVFGGSQGAQTINRIVREMMKSAQNPIRLTHQVGQKDWNNEKQIYLDLQSHGWTVVEVNGEVLKLAKETSLIEIRPFLFDMPKRYADADLVICRSGASTLAEIAAFAKASILIPLPAADNHQFANASQFAHEGAALLLEQKDLDSVKLLDVLEQLRGNPSKLQDMAIKARKLFVPNGAERIAREVILLDEQNV